MEHEKQEEQEVQEYQSPSIEVVRFSAEDAALALTTYYCEHCPQYCGGF